MKIGLKRISGDYHFEAESDSGCKIQMDGSVEIGGTNSGFRPMQLLLAALGGCSGIDIVSILKKQKQNIEDFSIEVLGERQHVAQHSVWKEIEITFKLKGFIDPDKARKAVQLSMDKYCSVSKILEPTAHVTTKIEINGKLV